MRSKNFVFAIVCVLGLSASAAMAAPIEIKLDMNEATAPITQSGFIGVRPSDNFGGGGDLPLDSSDGLPAGVTAGYGDNYGVGTRDRTVPGINVDISALGLDDLLRDFNTFRSFSNQGGDHFEIRGLPDGTYTVTIYSIDHHWGDSQTNAFEVNGIVAGPIGPPVDNDLSSMTDTVQVTLTGGAGTIRIATTDYVEDVLKSYRNINGVVITPEPATMGLLGIGFAGLAALRRRRR